MIDLQTTTKTELIVYGTPAEEAGPSGAKVTMGEMGLFDEVDICLMSHPTPFEIPNPMWLAAVALDITFLGKLCYRMKLVHIYIYIARIGY